MKKELLWGYMLYLSDHMWADENSIAKDWYVPKKYDEEISTEPKAWDDIVAFLAERQYNMVLIDVGDGIKFDRHPEIAAPNAWEKELLKKKLDEMRALGMEPIPKLNFSTCHDTWMKKYRRMICTPEYYEFCADVIAEVCEVFGNPRFFHLGMDEETAALQSTVEMVIVRNSALWWHDLHFLCDVCRKNGTRPWIWSDYLWNNEELFLKNMPKDVLQSNWYYEAFRNWNTATPAEANNARAIECYELLERHGYDQIPVGSTWSCGQNLPQTVAHGRKVIAPERLIGFMAAPWRKTTREDFYAHCWEADRMFYARKAFYPESLK